MSEPLMRILSLGAGVQSTTLYLMACAGELGSYPDCAIFADTGWEPEGVYLHLDWLRGQSSLIPIYTVGKRTLRADALAMNGRFASMPLHVLNLDGGDGMLRRQCTREYKVAPITKKIRELLGLRAGQRVKGHIELWLGISRDEAHRMRDNRERWITNCYPLVDRGISREACKTWLTVQGFPIPPKSACIGCPYHDDGYWRDMKVNRPLEWADAVTFDEAVRTGGRNKRLSDAYLHRSLVPLRDADISDPHKDQLALFGQECEGLCGV